MSTAGMPSVFGKPLRLPERMRKELREPLGRVVSAVEFQGEVQGLEGLVCVGDYCTGQALQSGAEPRVSVVDLKVERRRDVSVLNHPYWKRTTRLKVSNPPAHISAAIWSALERAFLDGGPFLIQVEGEEDLVTLPAIALAPKGYTVAYGQPGKGAVLVNVSTETKEKVLGILSRMEVLNGG